MLFLLLGTCGLLEQHIEQTRRSKTEVFVDQAVRDFTKPLDLLCMQSLQLKDSFPSEFDPSVIKVLSAIHIDRRKKDSLLAEFLKGCLGK